MIRGYFATIGTRRRPVVDAVLHFPTLGDRGVQVWLLVDTGAERTVLAPLDATRWMRECGIGLAALAAGVPSRGRGGQWSTRSIEAV